MIPFLPVLELLRGLFEITEQDSPRLARAKIAGALLMLDREFESALPLVFDFLGVPDPENPTPTMPPGRPSSAERTILPPVLYQWSPRVSSQNACTAVRSLSPSKGSIIWTEATSCRFWERNRSR